MTDSNIATEQDEYESFVESLTYTLDSTQHEKLEHFPVLYDSLKNLLGDLNSSDPQISSLVCLLDHFNQTFFEFLETIRPNSVK